MQLTSATDHPVRIDPPLRQAPPPLRAAPADALDESGLLHLVGYATTLASAAINKRFGRELAVLGLRLAEFSVLVLVDGNVDVNQKSLGDALEIAPPNLAVLIDRMVERGWVRRERSERDRRAHLIRLTPAGRALVRRARRLSLAGEADVLDVLAPQERKRLIELLHAIIRRARQARRDAARESVD